MKKLLITFGDDETEQVDPPYTVVPCILPDEEKCLLLFRDGMLPVVFYCFSDLLSFFEDKFSL